MSQMLLWYILNKGNVHIDKLNSLNMVNSLGIFFLFGLFLFVLFCLRQDLTVTPTVLELSI